MVVPHTQTHTPSHVGTKSQLLPIFLAPHNIHCNVATQYQKSSPKTTLSLPRGRSPLKKVGAWKHRFQMNLPRNLSGIHTDWVNSFKTKFKRIVSTPPRGEHRKRNCLRNLPSCWSWGGGDDDHDGESLVMVVVVMMLIVVRVMMMVVRLSLTKQRVSWACREQAGEEELVGRCNSDERNFWRLLQCGQEKHLKKILLTNFFNDDKRNFWSLEDLRLIWLSTINHIDLHTWDGLYDLSFRMNFFSTSEKRARYFYQLFRRAQYVALSLGPSDTNMYRRTQRTQL